MEGLTPSRLPGDPLQRTILLRCAPDFYDELKKAIGVAKKENPMLLDRLSVESSPFVPCGSALGFDSSGTPTLALFRTGPPEYRR